MLYNKSKDRKLNDKKILHKVKKRWVVVSSALLMTLGGVAAATHAPSVHADVNDPNAVKPNLNSNQKEVSQLTDKSGNSFNSQGPNLRSGSLNSTEVTSQARQLHSQILQNKAMSSANLGVQRPIDSSVNSKTLGSSSFNSQASDYNKLAKTVVNNNRSRNRSLGSSNQAYGTISIEDVDIHDGNKDVNNGFSSVTKPAGTPFTRSDQDSFIKLTPPGYIFNNVISAPTHFIANQNQEFKIAVVPRKPNQATSSKILLEYTDADNGDIIVGKVHEFSDTPETPFHLFQWEANRPDGYVLDPNDNNSNTISYQSSDKGNPTDIRHFIPNNDPNADQPLIKYLPGTQLIQIGVKKNSNDPNLQQVTMPVEYQYQGQTVPNGDTFTTGPVNTKFDITYFENNVPDNYQFAGVNNQEPQYYDPNGKVIINVVPNQVANDVTMPISYVYNKQTVGTTQTEGRSGQSFDVTPYEQNVTANGYHFDPQNDSVNAPNVYIKGYHVIINVSPNNRSSGTSMAQMPIDYVYDNQKVGTGTAYGVIGQSLNPQQYEQTVPDGYEYANGVVSAPQSYTNGKSITINVVPINHANSNSQQTTSYITVQWINGLSGKVSDSLMLPGNPGQPFPLAYYENSAPEGTHSTGHLISNPVTKFTTNNQTVKIQVLPNQTPAYQYGTITVQCVDPNGNPVGHSDTTNHKVGTPFNLLSELHFDIPSNYHFVKFLSGEGIHQYDTAPQSVRIEVALNNTTPAPNSNSGTGNRSNQQTSGTSVTPTNNQTSGSSTSQLINNNVPNANVTSTSINSNSYVPSSSSQVSNNNVSSASNSDVNTNSNSSENEIDHLNAKGNRVNTGQDSNPITDHDANNSDLSTLESSNPSRYNNNYGYHNHLDSNDVVSNRSEDARIAADNSIGDNFNGDVNSVSSASDESNSSNGDGSRLPQTNENNEDRELAEIGSILTAISVDLSQLGYSMKKRHRHD